LVQEYPLSTGFLLDVLGRCFSGDAVEIPYFYIVDFPVKVQIIQISEERDGWKCVQVSDGQTALTECGFVTKEEVPVICSIIDIHAILPWNISKRPAIIKDFSPITRVIGEIIFLPAEGDRIGHPLHYVNETKCFSLAELQVIADATSIDVVLQSIKYVDPARTTNLSSLPFLVLEKIFCYFDKITDIANVLQADCHLESTLHNSVKVKALEKQLHEEEEERRRRKLEENRQRQEYLDVEREQREEELYNERCYEGWKLDEEREQRECELDYEREQRELELYDERVQREGVMVLDEKREQREVELYEEMGQRHEELTEEMRQSRQELDDELRLREFELDAKMDSLDQDLNQEFIQRGQYLEEEIKLQEHEERRRRLLELYKARSRRRQKQEEERRLWEPELAEENEQEVVN